MPTIQVPLLSWDAVPKLKRSKKFSELAAEKVSLKQQEDRIKKRLEEINQELYLCLDADLPEGAKSVEFEGYMLTKIDAGTSNRFDKKMLMERPLRCTGCSECKRKKVSLFVTAVDIEACTTEGVRKPTVSAEKINKDRTQKRTRQKK